MISMRTLVRINGAVSKARLAHPSVESDLFKELVEEVGEVARAILDGNSIDEIESEILDTIAVLVRMLERA